jgi:catechol 2,3-dioxygenase-like lactoylglutathione lyase family enzyme
MFSHVTVGSNDIARARAFYDGVGKPLGLVLHKASSESGLGYSRRQDGRPQLWIVRPLDKQAATVGNGITIGLEADTRPAVDAAYAAAMANGGKDEGKPGIRAHYHPNYYGAYVRDPDGNKVCIVCHRPA